MQRLADGAREGVVPAVSSPAASARTLLSWQGGILAAVLGASLLMFSPLLADPDLWGHVRFGQDLWQTGHIIRPDTYSYLTGGQPWINHEWLAEAVYAQVYNSLGAAGLIALNSALSLVIVGILYVTLLARGSPALIAGLIVAFFAMLLRPGVLNVRPQVFTYLLLLVVTLLIYRAEHGDARSLWAAVPVMALWANLHGGVLAGAGLLLLWGGARLLPQANGRSRKPVRGAPSLSLRRGTPRGDTPGAPALAPERSAGASVGSWPDEDPAISGTGLGLAAWQARSLGVLLARPRVLTLLGLPPKPTAEAGSPSGGRPPSPSVEGLRAQMLGGAASWPDEDPAISGTGLLACLLALLANPYGFELVRFLVRTATVPRPEIAEWKPLQLTGSWGLYYLGGVALVLLGLVFSRRERKPALLPLLGCVALLPLLSSRHTPLFAVVAPVLAGEHIADAAARWLPAHAGSPRLRPSWMALLPALAGLALAGLAIPRLARIEVDPAVSDIPAPAVALLRAGGVTGNLAVEFNWGEYVLWHLGPGVQVSIDGRRETVYPDAVYRENLAFMLGKEGWQRLPDRPETDMALVDRTRPAFALMQARPGWVLAYADPTCGIFVREGSPALARIRRTAVPDLPSNGAGLAFP